MKNVFDTVYDALCYYYDVLSVGSKISVNPVIHGVTLSFHVYRLPSFYEISPSVNMQNLFPLCTSNDCATQVLICDNMIIDSGVICSPPPAAARASFYFAERT